MTVLCLRNNLNYLFWKLHLPVISKPSSKLNCNYVGNFLKLLNAL